jgi:hypothetical protein
MDAREILIFPASAKIRRRRLARTLAVRGGWPNSDRPIIGKGVVHFWSFLGSRRPRGMGQPLRVGLGRCGCFVRWRPISLSGSGVLVLQRSEAQQSEPMRVAFAGHQFSRALADALGQLAAHIAPMVEEEPQQIQVQAAQVAAQCEVVAQPRVEVFHQRTAARGPRRGRLIVGGVFR